MWQRIYEKKRRRKKPVMIFWMAMFAIFILLMAIGYNHFFVRSGNNGNKANTANVFPKQNSADVNNNAENEPFSKDSLLQNSSLIPADTGTFKRSLPHPKGNQYAASGNRKNHKNGDDHSVAIMTSSMKTNDKINDTTEADHHQISDTTATASSEKPVSNNAGTTASSQNKEMPESDTHDKFSIEIFASPFYPVNNISSSNTVYEQLLENSAAMQLSAAFGIRFRYAIVPLLISYNTPLANSFSAAVNAGIVVNVSSKFKGAIPLPSGEPADVANANVYYSNRGSGLYVSVALTKSIGQKIYFFAEPYFQRSFKNMANSFQPFKQKIHFAGINFGAGYKFF
jgi:uncharacterized membrane protein (DUF485 family)